MPIFVSLFLLYFSLLLKFFYGNLPLPSVFYFSLFFIGYPILRFFSLPISTLLFLLALVLFLKPFCSNIASQFYFLIPPYALLIVLDLLDFLFFRILLIYYLVARFRLRPNILQVLQNLFCPIQLNL